MQPIIIRTYLVQILLLVMATSFAFLAIGVPENEIAFWTAQWGSLTHGEAQIPIVLGVIPFSNLALFLSFCFLYLSFEFYGFKSAFYGALCIAIVLLGQFYLFYALQKFSPVGLSNNLLMATVPLSNYSQQEVHAMCTAVGIGFPAILTFAVFFKKITKNYFMFIRFSLGGSLGFAVFVGIREFVGRFGELGPMSIFMESITPYLQYVVLSLVIVPALYILRVFLGIFRGKSVEGEWQAMSGSRGLFKAKSAPANDVADEDEEEENTVSQNTSLDDLDEEESAEDDSEADEKAPS